MNDIDLAALMAEAEAILAQSTKPKKGVPPEPKLKLNSVKPKKQPVIKSGQNYHYDPKTYNELHKVANWILIDNEADAKALSERLMQEHPARLAIDTETKPLTEYKTAVEVPEHIIRRYVKKNANDVPFGLSVCDGNFAWYITAGITRFKDIIEDETIEKILANAKYDMHLLMNIGIVVKGRIHDVQMLIKLWNENLPSYKLKDLAVRFISKDANKYEIMKDNWMYENKTTDWTAVPKELMADYGAGDGWYTWVLMEKFEHYMDDFSMRSLYDTECAVLNVAFDMERTGFLIDRGYFMDLRKEFAIEIEEGLNKIYDRAGKIININSSQQVIAFLIEQGVPKDSIKFNEATGNPVFDKTEKERLAKRFDIVNDIQAVGKTEKLLGTYVNNILGTLPANDRTHCNINAMEATTGRMSITDPPLQTLPKKDKRIRRGFIPAPETALFFFDLDQVEYRLFAHYSKSMDLIEAIKKGWDVHRATAATIFHVPYDDVTDEQRSLAKTLNFALVYGVGADHFAELCSTKEREVSVPEAKIIKADYFRAIPEAKNFTHTVQETIKTKGYVRNLFFRRRRLSKDEVYKGPNALLQGCAADFVKAKIVLVYEMLKQANYLTRGENIVHDEAIYQIPFVEIDEVVPKIKSTIDDYTTFRVPITCGCEWSLLSWGDKMDYDLTKTFEENKQIFVEEFGEVHGMKADWYKTVEAKVYEYYTLEHAIFNLKRQGDTAKAEEKQETKTMYDDIILRLSKSDRELLQHVYDNPDIDNDKQLFNILGVSSATFYRNKRNILKNIALRLGIL
jgi:DNA polymerase I-like protein with 3'-5' exonuclease and polymerase domains